MYVIVKSKKDKGKALKQHILKDIVPLGFDVKIEETQGKHQRVITDRDNPIKAPEFRNEEHRQKILRLNKEIDDLIKNRHVACCGYFDKVLCFIEKNNNKEAHPYYVIQCQYNHLEKYKRCLRIRHPKMKVADECDDPNAIHRWNIVKSEVIEKSNYYKNNFSLTEEKRELLEVVLDATI